MSKKPTINGLPVFNPWNEGFSSKVPNWLNRRTEVSAQAKLVYGRLAQYAGKSGRAYPCVKTLAAEVGLKPRSVTNYLKELREKKLVTVRSGAVAGKANRYFFVEHEWKLEGEYDIEMGEEEDTDYTPMDEEEGEGGRHESTQGVGTEVPTGVGTEVPTGYAREYLQNDPHRKTLRKNDPQRDGGSADAPPSRSPEPKGETPAPAPGSYQEKAARDPDAKVEFDPTKGQEGIEDLAKKAKEKTIARTTRQLREQAKVEQAIENLNGNGRARLTKEQMKAVRRLERTWKAEMRKAFPDLAIAEWDGRNCGQAWKLIEKYDGRSAAAAVKYVVRRWDEFKKQYFKGVGTVPSVGMILRLHETIVPVAAKWEKHADTLEEWEKFYADHPYEDPPAELEKKYRAAKAKLNQLGLA